MLSTEESSKKNDIFSIAHKIDCVFPSSKTRCKHWARGFSHINYSIVECLKFKSRLEKIQIYRIFCLMGSLCNWWCFVTIECIALLLSASLLLWYGSSSFESNIMNIWKRSVCPPFHCATEHSLTSFHLEWEAIDYFRIKIEFAVLPSLKCYLNKLHTCKSNNGTGHMILALFLVILFRAQKENSALVELNVW